MGWQRGHLAFGRSSVDELAHRAGEGARLMSGRRIVVTGGSSGLGAAVVDVVAARGDTISILDLKPPHEAATVAEVRLVDLADPRAAAAAVAEAAAALGGLDAVVTCAG